MYFSGGWEQRNDFRFLINPLKLVCKLTVNPNREIVYAVI
jgi:hypothetical protein